MRKNGSRNGQPKYQCTACRHQALFVPVAVGKAQAYAQVATLLLERVSQRAIVRLTSVSRPTIVKLETGKKAAATPRLRPKLSRPQVLELDEMWPFVGQRKRKVWLWLAIERVSRRIVAWVLGCRGAATARALRQVLPAVYQQRTTYYTE
ncbi:MAG: IS1 family transposase [Hymenobacter sp.]|nr:IS1 family transposase [Hymenobacter sp.]